MGAAVLSDSDLDRIGDRVKAMFLEARSEGGCLPCSDHEERTRKIEKALWKWAGAALVLSVLGASFGSYLAPRVLDKSQAVPSQAPTTGGP